MDQNEAPLLEAVADNHRPGHDQSQDIRAYLSACTPQIIDRLSEWVRVPSVAGVPERRHNLVRSAKWLTAELRDAGFPTTEIWSAGESPAVFAQWCPAPGAPTVLVYSHHDVRAVKEENWDETSPFDPVLRDGRLYGRGSSDAKAQILAHIWGLLAHLMSTGRTEPALNLKMLIEGEEEAGSPGLAALLEANRDPPPGRCRHFFRHAALEGRPSPPSVPASAACWAPGWKFTGRSPTSTAGRCRGLHRTPL